MKNTLTHLSNLGLLCISGPDAQKFLQGQLSCDLTAVLPTQSQLGAHCNPQGRILSLFRLFLYQENYYLQMPLDLVATALTALQKYAVFFKTTLQDASQALQQLSLTGLDAEKQLTTLFTKLPNKTGETLVTNNILIMKIPSTHPHYIMIGDASAITTLKKQLSEQTNTGDENFWKFTQISAGIPSVYATTSGKFLPHELNLQLINGISFEKGCYTGQEIIARMHYRSQLKKHMYYACATAKPLPPLGADIFNPHACGTMVDSCQVAEDQCHFLAIVNDTDKETQQLFLDPNKTEPVKFLSLPYDLGTRPTYV